MTRSILITGCSSGIGADSAIFLREKGWRVFASCRKPEDCDRLRAAGFDSPRIDLSDEASIVNGLAEVLAATGGTLDALYNNAAFVLPGAVEDVPTDGLRAVFEANVFGLHSLTLAAIPVMRAQGHGRIVQCSSVLGIVPAPWRGAYAASKFALEGLTDSLRIEMRDTPIRVITLRPGPIETPIRRNSIAPFERWIDWRGSARAAQYEAHLLKRLYEPGKPTRWQLPPREVSRVLLRALRDRNPRPVYAVTAPTKLMQVARRLLPQRAMDWMTVRG